MLHWLPRLLLSLLFAALPAAAAPPLKAILLPYTSALTLMQVHQPLREHLAAQLGREVEFYTAGDFESFYRDSVSGQFDLAVTGPHFGFLAIEQGFTPLVRYQATLRPLLVVRAGSGLTEPGQLRGRRVLLSNRLSVSSIAGRQYLSELGLTPGGDYQLLESPSHTSAMMAVALGEADAAITTHTPLRQAEPELRSQLAWFELPVAIPHLFTIARPGLPAAEQEAIRAALFAFPETEAGRRFFEATGYAGYAELTAADVEAMRPYGDLVRTLLGEGR